MLSPHLSTTLHNSKSPTLALITLPHSLTSISSNTFSAFFIVSHPQTMIPGARQYYRRFHFDTVPSAISERAPHTFLPERHTGTLVRKRGGLITVPVKLWPAPETNHRMTKLLLNVTIERSLGPVQVVISAQKTVRDLIKAAVEIYVREKRRPLVKETDPHRFELHYSQFSLESLRRDEKLIKLGSRNFFLCSSKSKASVKVCNCSEEVKKATNSVFPWTNFTEFLL